MKVLKDWNCEFSVDAKSKISVGQPYSILCKGTTPVDTDSKVLLFPNNDKVKYDVVILNRKFKSEYELFVKATAWKTGVKSLKDYNIVIDDQVIALKGPSFRVKSLLKKDTEMHLPPGLSVQKVPTGAKIAGGILLVLLIGYIIYWFRKNRKYDLALIKLHSLKTSLSPYHEFHKKLRKIETEILNADEEVKAESLNNLVVKFKQHLINYISLTVNEPLFAFTEKQQLKVFKKHIYKKRKIDLSLIKTYISLTYELKALEKDINKARQVGVLAKDFMNLIQATKDFVDRLEKELKNA